MITLDKSFYEMEGQIKVKLLNVFVIVYQMNFRTRVY
jgi:hypothetical protein